MNNAQEIAKIIRLETSNKNILISKMLNDIGLGRNSMANLDNGSMLRADSLGKIADYLGVSVDYLLGRTENPEVQTNNNNTTITGSNIVNGNVGNSSNVNTATASNNTPDETTEQVAKAFQNMSLADKAKVITLIAELTEKNKTA